MRHPIESLKATSDAVKETSLNFGASEMVRWMLRPESCLDEDAKRKIRSEQDLFFRAKGLGRGR